MFVCLRINQPDLTTNIGSFGSDVRKLDCLVCDSHCYRVKDVEILKHFDCVLRWETVKVDIVDTFLVSDSSVGTIDSYLGIKDCAFFQRQDSSADRTAKNLEALYVSLFA